jgi:hypothetical protein
MHARELDAHLDPILAISKGAGARSGVVKPVAARRSADHRARHSQSAVWLAVGMALCRPLSGGLWEVRSSLPSRREARVLFGFHEGMLIALHAFIKKGQKTSPEELVLARQRMKEVLS